MPKFAVCDDDQLAQARQLISRDCIAYLASVVLRGDDDTPRIEDIPVVREFQDVFPTELPGPDVLQKAEDKRIRRFGIREKLSPRFIGPYEILERVGPVVYRLALPPNLSGVHNVFHVSVLRKYIFDPAHVLEATPLELQDDLSFKEQPVRILAREVQKLRNRDIQYVKVIWSNHEEREATWELENALQKHWVNVTHWTFANCEVRVFDQCSEFFQIFWRVVDNIPTYGSYPENYSI
uniref:Tf2-1-like SH3-like domain-containing protein n=1 Tax=Ananas comosus var. bracteatus TaxID=296719 RepID=A0A6V7NY95_ANACO|nr:unnamed protein product [Ananas comosus var. bracteatus]